ncbi:NAD(P)-dependent oxidoreductase [Patescibacteria group bacterium]|nr:NAD(P)-dependent oxidoreductase [Patescibacteria group bacterium]MBU4078151.1 NAD(P)-dependent oxidoreductase [Patescibacteria group bacterium]
MTNNKKTLLITGSTGFIGSHLVEKLVDKYHIVALVPSSDIGMRPLPKDACIEYAGIEDFDLVKEIISKHQPKVIVHLGAITPVRYSFENPGVYQKINYLATINLVESAAKIKDFEKFVFASTMETYGWQSVKKPFKENLFLNPDSPYAVSKVAAEKYIQMLARAFGFPAVILKACNTFGRKNEKDYIVEHIITEMLAGRSPQLGTPQAIRDLMYVSDHVNGYVKAIEFEMPGTEEIKEKLEENQIAFTFNIGNGYQLTMKQLAEKIGDIIGFKGEIKTGFPKSYPWRPSTADYLSLDASYASQILNWKPEISLEQGLQKSIEFWKDNL